MRKSRRKASTPTAVSELAAVNAAVKNIKITAAQLRRA